MSEQGDLFDLRYLRHSHGLSTEEAALSKVAPTLAAMKAKIYGDLLMEGERGLTPDEFSDRHGKLINTVRRRFTDMWKDGLIRHHPDLNTRPNRAGNECVVWVIGKDPYCSGSSDTRIQRLREQLIRAGIKPCC
jgi:hypothetical protein